eukprot:6729202-Prymnesium_polylepis.1
MRQAPSAKRHAPCAMRHAPCAMRHALALASPPDLESTPPLALKVHLIDYSDIAPDPELLG